MNGSTIELVKEVKYTLLPFYDFKIATILFGIMAVLLFVLVFVRRIVYKRSMTLHKASTSVVFAYIEACLCNLLMFTFLYWYWALPVSAVISLIHVMTVRADVKDANSEERIGVWGLNKEIRRIRGEIFNDLTVEEQIEYSKTVKEYKFGALQISLFFAITLAIPLIFTLVCYLLDIGYLYAPVLIAK